ncbi:MAG: homocysteine S-methyltransferase family protein [Actinomycetes bacterium]
MADGGRVTVLDGGLGRELLRIGAPFRQPEWSALALLEGASWVVQAHRNFLDAGAEVVTTNSYAVVPFHLGDDRFAARGRELAELSGRLAREAAAGRARVAGSLPPLFGSYRPDLFDAVAAPSIVDPLVDGLGPHVDVWLGETLSSIADVVAVRAELDRAVDGRELWISYTLDDHRPGTLRSGEPVDDAVVAALDVGATTVLFNCCQAETITPAIDVAVARTAGTAAVGAYANRFVDSHTDDGEANEQLARFRDDLDPTSYGEFVSRWLDAGATVVGGCCGMQPEHVARIRQLVDTR